jgi:hypothetical protein
MLNTKRALAAAVAVAILTAPAAVAAQAALPADSLERVRTAVRFFYAGEADSLLVRMTPATLEAIGGRAGLLAGLETVGTRAGDEVSVVQERWNMRNGQRQYWRTSKVSIFEGDFLVRINLDAAGNITGLGMGPAANAPSVESVGPVLPKP